MHLASFKVNMENKLRHAQTNPENDELSNEK